MEPQWQGRACTPKCSFWLSFSIEVPAHRRGLLRRRMTYEKESLRFNCILKVEKNWDKVVNFFHFLQFLATDIKIPKKENR
jgi:hypothetical protein